MNPSAPRPPATPAPRDGPPVPVHGRSGSSAEAAVVALLLLAFAVTLTTSTWWKSPTVDEYAHLPAGLRALRFGDLELYGKTPPLARQLFSLPALAASPELPPAPPGNRMAGWYPWRYADLFVASNLSERGPAYVHGLYRRARGGVIALSLLLAVAVYAWARAAWGAVAGVAALAFLTVEPNLLAHGRLATTDVPAALGVTAAVGLATLAVWRPRPAAVLAAGLAAGAALASKHTAVLIAPVWIGLAVVATADRLRARTGRPWLPAAVVAMAGALALASLAAAYGFSGVGARLRELPLASASLQRLAASPAGALPLPLPAAWVAGLDAQRADLEYVEWPNYLLGRWSADGWWYYYPLALVLKTPLGLLAALALAAAAALRLRIRGGPPRRADRSELARLTAWTAGLSLAALLGTATFATAVHTGVRWVLPAIPFIALALGGLASRSGRRTRLLLAGCWLVAVAEVAAVHPHHLAFFNRAAGGPDDGWRLLASSNVDWGQDLVYLRRELDRRGIRTVRLAYFGHADPAAYGIRYTVPLPGASGADAVLGRNDDGSLVLAPGWYAISANHLVGHPYVVNDHGRWLATAADRRFGHDLFASLRVREPDAVVGGSVLLYRIDG